MGKPKEERPWFQVSDEIATEVIRRYKVGESIQEICRNVDICVPTASLIATMKKKKHLPRDYNIPEPTEFERWRSKNLWYTNAHEKFENVMSHVLYADECIEWPLTKMATGYGEFSYYHNTFLAHRISLEIKLGRRIGIEMFSCHTCDNRPCVNPNHLYEGTVHQNNKDMADRDRSTYHEKNPMAKFTEPQIIEFLKMYKGGFSKKEISEYGGISVTHLNNLITGKDWMGV